MTSVEKSKVRKKSADLHRAELRRRILDLQRGGFEGADVVDVALADLGGGVGAVLVEDLLHVPARDLANDADDAAGAVLAVVTVEEEGVVLAIEDHGQDGLHDVWRDGFLFGALHVDEDVADPIAGDERPEIVVDVIFLHQRSVGIILAVDQADSKQGGDVHKRLELQSLQEGKVGRLGIAAAIDARENEAEVEGPAIGRRGEFRARAGRRHGGCRHCGGVSHGCGRHGLAGKLTDCLPMLGRLEDRRLLGDDDGVLGAGDGAGVANSADGALCLCLCLRLVAVFGRLVVLDGAARATAGAVGGGGGDDVLLVAMGRLVRVDARVSLGGHGGNVVVVAVCGVCVTSIESLCSAQTTEQLVCCKVEGGVKRRRAMVVSRELQDA